MRTEIKTIGNFFRVYYSIGKGNPASKQYSTLEEAKAFETGIKWGYDEAISAIETEKLKAKLKVA